MENKRIHYYIVTLYCLLAFFFAAAFAVALQGCVRRELEEFPVGPPIPEGEGYAEITLDWSAVPRSGTARYLFYDESGALIREAPGVSGAYKGTLPAGRYRLVVHNEDAEQVYYCGLDRYEQAQVMAQEAGTVAEYAGAASGEYAAMRQASDIRQTSATCQSTDIPCILEPGRVYSTGVCRESAELVVKAGEIVRATAAPAAQTRQVHFNFVVTSENGVRSLTGTLNGVYRGIYLCSGQYDVSSSCSVAFTAAPSGETGTSSASAIGYAAQIGVFSLFAAEEESPPGASTLNIVLTDTDRAEYTGTFDITATLKEIIAGNDGVIPIEIPIEVNIRLEPVGGMTANVKPWDEGGTGEGEFNGKLKVEN